MKLILQPNVVWPPKSDRAIKKSKFNFDVEYPTLVSLKRTLTGKLTADGQNFIYCVRFEESVKKPPKKADS